jgi:ATP synthase F1 delta subunit
MKITSRQYAEALYQVLSETAPADMEKVMDNFVQALQDNGHLELWPEIEAEFKRFEAVARGNVPVDVTVARPGDENKILPELHALLGRNLVLKKNVDAGLIGGVVVETAEERLDASVKNHLKNLKKSLIN